MNSLSNFVIITGGKDDARHVFGEGFKRKREFSSLERSVILIILE